MPSINMIALRREQKRRQEQNVRKLLYSITGEVGLVVAVAFVMTARILVTQNHISDLSAQLDKLKPQVAQIQTLQAQTVALQPKVDTLDGAKEDTLFWYDNFYAVTTSLPARTWLTSLGTGGAGASDNQAPGTTSGPDPTLSIAGVAMSQANVGDSMLRMNQSPMLDHVDLAYVQAQKIGKADAVSFQMTVHLKPEAAPDTATNTADTQGAVNGTKS
ncbi:MAG: PilN domain-containing protein [Janthinobacterium lividum]